MNSEVLSNVCQLQFVCNVYIYYRLAEEELLREAQRGASRAAVGGALAWQKCPLQPTNKRFLVNMIQYTLNANKLKEEYQLKKSETKKHHSGHSVQKVNSPQSPRHNRKRTRKDTCCVHDNGQKQETYKRKASKKRNS
jgi:hypothetical protein